VGAADAPRRMCVCVCFRIGSLTTDGCLSMDPTPVHHVSQLLFWPAFCDRKSLAEHALSGRVYLFPTPDLTDRLISAETRRWGWPFARPEAPIGLPM